MEHKFIINDCYGGFSFSDFFIEEYNKRSPEKFNKSYPGQFEGDYLRDDENAIKIIEEHGSEKCSGKCAKLIVKTIKTKYLYVINEYDGLESVSINFDIWLRCQIERLDLTNLSFEELKSKIEELKNECELNTRDRMRF